MTKRRFRLCDEDQQEYGGPEWVALDWDALVSSRARDLERIEKETGYPIVRLIEAWREGGTALGIRLLVWVARRQNGLRTEFKDFQIRSLQVDSEFVADDAGQADPAPLDESPQSSSPPPPNSEPPST